MADLHTFLLIVVFSFQLPITSTQKPIFAVSDEWADSWSVQYQHNLDDLLQKLNNTNKAFEDSIEGEGPYEAYGFYLCRGDATDQICRSCVHNATSTIVNQCPTSTCALIAYDYCMHYNKIDI
ncbi:hypothetical protein Nepgr_021302 [Nepenthes gracilis]|uniref:Gnk2-homologous domain-containing protein n=1 Tax=Nepenthes gracilis TaxID=150966 RepID=A0AAD3T0K6_NEPGR|nr:hypothetical protein Nepgr_021302 [Nepenthes gracilis]